MDRGRARHDKETDMKTGPTSVSMSGRFCRRYGSVVSLFARLTPSPYAPQAAGTGSVPFGPGPGLRRVKEVNDE